MIKKSLIILSIFCMIIFTFSFVSASNLQSGMSNAGKAAGNGIETVFNATGNTLQNAGNGISNVMNNAGRGMRNMVNGIEDGMDEDTDTGMNMTNGIADDGYTANRTASAGTTNGINNTLVWVILAVSTVAIIALVWYYTTQTNDRYDDRDRH